MGLLDLPLYEDNRRLDTIFTGPAVEVRYES